MNAPFWREMPEWTLSFSKEEDSFLSGISLQKGDMALVRQKFRKNNSVYFFGLQCSCSLGYNASLLVSISN